MDHVNFPAFIYLKFLSHKLFSFKIKDLHPGDRYISQIQLFGERPVKKKTIGSNLVLFAFAGLLISCTTTASDPNGNGYRSAQRDFQRIVRDDQGNPILRIAGKYIGKQPQERYETDIPWTTVDTDFYNIGFENLTRKKIRFVSKKIYQRDPTEVRRAKTNQTPALLEFTNFLKTPDPNFEELEPLEERKLINWAIHTDNQMPHNVSNVVFRIHHRDNEYTFNIFLIYQK